MVIYDGRSLRASTVVAWASQFYCFPAGRPPPTAPLRMGTGVDLVVEVEVVFRGTTLWDPREILPNSPADGHFQLGEKQSPDVRMVCYSPAAPGLDNLSHIECITSVREANIYCVLYPAIKPTA